MSQTIGVVSDTHGLVRPEAMDALRGVDLMLHAGDIGSISVVEALREIAPVHAVRGNVDTGTWAAPFPERKTIQAGPHSIFVLHNLDELPLDPAAAGINVVISGHSHQPKIFHKDGVMYLNPGSAGPRRFKLPVSVALLRIDESRIDADIVKLI